jgi:replication fork protection complex subunit Tof1/Swi1
MYEAKCEKNEGSEKLDRIAVACLELLVPLTWPLELNRLTSPVNHYRHAPALEQARLRYKGVLLNHSSKKVFKAIIRLTIPTLMKRRQERSMREEGILRLCIYLFRNILAIDIDTKDSDIDSSTSRNHTIEVFREQKALDFLITVSAGMGVQFEQQSTGCLECLFYLLRGLKVEDIFVKPKSIGDNEKENIPVVINGGLKDLLDAEKNIRKDIQRGASTRHNRFGTMISVVAGDAHRYTVSGQTALAGNAQTLQQLDSRKTWHARARRRVESGVSTIFTIAHILNCWELFVSWELISGKVEC